MNFSIVNKNDNQESSPNQPPFNAVGKAQYSFESIFGDGGIEPEPASLDKIPEFPPAQDNTPPPPQALDAIQGNSSLSLNVCLRLLLYGNKS